MEFGHETVVLRRGQRSRLPIIVAVHSTVLGPAVGGCRMWGYARWEDGLRDALRLSEGMTRKCAAAGLSNGGGKTVVVLPADRPLTADERRAALYDVGDIVAEFGGRYLTGPDAGTGVADMGVIGERTEYVFCRPEADGGSGDPSPFTALGVVAALRATCLAMSGSPELAGKRFAVIGAGNVGAQIARQLAAAGAALILSDVDPAKRSLAAELGAEFADPESAVTAEVDVLVPAALGGLLTRELVPRLRCIAVAGAANNQLAEPDVAELLRAGDILWAPDYIANAGGVVNSVSREILGDDPATAVKRIESIADTLTGLFETAARTGITTAAAADALARQRLAAAV
ncbi:Glu/Leu/Phe/Val dehydrogenase dimerization domain-containing protein [Nocardia sp. alder85J]|uniref:Glu/Leu/Phe/Val dehydrogenase dimerization domain-containing protein n=1 Tax=Nocardia sp. alder85J TaxID=2862949 RepID=UPI001CD1E646|nr:Glu/Leu/Phe/Val dehydrogenase dimerization domain-containing protein [Nocardia sp. alder85J]MCX4094148.1 valine dehydrogenase [Nocardia sp. alder85J]